MSIGNIKDKISVSSQGYTRFIISFLSKSDLKSFSHKRKISNSVQSLFVNFLELKSDKIVAKRDRKRVYFADDITLPSSEISPIATYLSHIVTNEEYKEIITYKDCYNNDDFLDAMRRRCEESREKKRRKRERDVIIYPRSLWGRL